MSTVLQPQSISETIRAAFPFTVDKYRLSGPENLRTNHFGLFRSDSLECIGNACREGYNPHTVEDVARVAEAAAGVFEGTATAKCIWKHGHVVSLAPSDEYRRAVCGTDTVFPRLLISARFDGRAFEATLGFYRDRCRNLAMLQETENIVRAKFKHTDALGDSISSLVAKLSRVAAAWYGTVEAMRRLEATQVNLADFLRDVYPETGSDSKRTKAAAKRRIESIFKRISRERFEADEPAIRSDWMVTAWEAFNGVQGYTQHSKKRKGSPTAYERAIIALDDKHVKAAERLAFQLAG